jgi:alpha-glucosidase
MAEKMRDQTLWWQEGAIYQIYPRSYKDTTGNGIGDLQGILQKLDYIQELGVDALWLSPVTPSPDVDFGYDVSDYTDIDPKYGSLLDFEKLIANAERRGIKVIMDMVLNHTSDQHAWFQQSKISQDNAYHDWYIWADAASRRKAPNNWQSVFGGKAWEWEETRDQFYYHMFYKEQPDLNWRNPKARAALMDVLRFWLDKGVKGFRLDVFNVYLKDKFLRDNPTKPFGIRPFDRQNHEYDIDQPELMDALHEIRKVLDGYQETYIIGETFLSTPDKAASYSGARKLHQTFNFKFLECAYSPSQFAQSILDWETSLGDDAWPNYVLNNHDVKRSASRYGIGEDDKRLKVLAAMMLTLRGTPFIYYGEEIGMREKNLRRKEIRDPIGKRYWPFFKGRDGCRTPMQWSDELNAGFSSEEPWLPIHENFPNRNVAIQNEDPESLLNFYRQLLALRRETDALNRGEMRLLEGMPKGILAYERIYTVSEAFVLLNFRKANITCDLSKEKKVFQKVLSSVDGLYRNQAISKVHLKPDEALVLTSLRT